MMKDQQYPLYHQELEHESCGVGAIVDLSGKSTHRTVDQALSIVERLAHRAGSDALGTTGDGVGIMTDLPHHGVRLQLFLQIVHLYVRRHNLVAHNGTVFVECREDALKLLVTLSDMPVLTNNVVSRHDEGYYDDGQYHDDEIGIVKSVFVGKQKNILSHSCQWFMVSVTKIVRKNEIDKSFYFFSK